MEEKIEKLTKQVKELIDIIHKLEHKIDYIDDSILMIQEKCNLKPLDDSSYPFNKKK